MPRRKATRRPSRRSARTVLHSPVPDSARSPRTLQRRDHRRAGRRGTRCATRSPLPTQAEASFETTASATRRAAHPPERVDLHAFPTHSPVLHSPVETRRPPQDLRDHIAEQQPEYGDREQPEDVCPSVGARQRQAIAPAPEGKDRPADEHDREDGDDCPRRRRSTAALKSEVEGEHGDEDDDTNRPPARRVRTGARSARRPRSCR